MRSMTGYGTAKSILPVGEVEIELKTLNSKNLDVNLRLPQQLSAFEMPIREWIRSAVSRGKVNCTININRINPDQGGGKVDENMIRHYHSVLTTIKNVIGSTESLKIDHFFNFKDIFYQENHIEEDETLTQQFEKLFKEGITALNLSRENEGENLKKDCLNRIGMVRKTLTEIEPMVLQNPQLEFNRQKERIKNLLDGGTIDDNRMTQELAILADRVDVTEEVIRFKSHLDLFVQTANKNEPVGKKINFILQEMHRELNTMGVKTSIVEISHKVVSMKEEVEKLREQIQNIE